VLRRGGDQGVDVEHPTVRRLDDADGHEGRRAPDRPDQLVEGHGPDRRRHGAPGTRNGEEDGREVALGDEHLGVRRQRRQPPGPTKVETEGPVATHVGSTPAEGAHAVRARRHVLVEGGRLEAALLPAGEHLVHLRHRLPGREPQDAVFRNPGRASNCDRSSGSTTRRLGRRRCGTPARRLLRALLPDSSPPAGAA
jgi:hypothetical protein